MHESIIYCTNVPTFNSITLHAEGGPVMLKNVDQSLAISAEVISALPTYFQNIS